MKPSMVACAFAAIVGLASAISLACYAAEGMGDTYPRWILVSLGITAAGQAAIGLTLLVKRALWSAILFVAISAPLAGVELMTTISVDYARNFLSTAAVLFGVVALVVVSIKRRRDRASITYNDLP